MVRLQLDGRSTTIELLIKTSLSSQSRNSLAAVTLTKLFISARGHDVYRPLNSRSVVELHSNDAPTTVESK